MLVPFQLICIRCSSHDNFLIRIQLKDLLSHLDSFLIIKIRIQNYNIKSFFKFPDFIKASSYQSLLELYKVR